MTPENSPIKPITEDGVAGDHTLNTKTSLSPNAETTRIITKWRDGNLTITQSEAEVIAQTLEMYSQAIRMAKGIFGMSANRNRIERINTNTAKRTVTETQDKE